MTTPGHAIAFVLFAVVAAITPGPSNLILASIGANVGLLRGLPSLGGQVLGMGFMLFVVAFGLGNAVLASPVLSLPLKWVGAGVLLWLSWKIATAGRGGTDTDRPQLGFWGAAGFQWINPKAWLIGASAVGTYLRPEAGTVFAQATELGLLFVLAALPSCFVWLAFGASLQRFLRAERTARVFNAVMGLLLAGTVLLFIW